MASLIHTRYYVDGNSRAVRRITKQGRKSMPTELRRTQTIIIYTTKSEKDKFLVEKSKSSMSQSAFGDLILFLGLERYKQLFDSNNCSTQ